MPPIVSNVVITEAPDSLRKTGLLAWARVLVDGWWEVDGLSIRQTRSGECVVTYPSRKDSRGRTRHYFRPVDDKAREAIEKAVLNAAREWRAAG